MTSIEAVPFCNYFFINSFEETMPYHLENLEPVSVAS